VLSSGCFKGRSSAIDFINGSYQPMADTGGIKSHCDETHDAFIFG
jgi:hypothetical protein